MPETRIVLSIATVPATAWNACAAGAIEDHAALLAIEKAQLPGFDMRYLLVEEGSRLLAVAPVFIAPYPLETMMEGGIARMVRGAGQVWPSFFKPRLICIGSPCIETAGIGFAPEVDREARGAVAACLLLALEAAAVVAGCRLLGIKDLACDDIVPLQAALAARAYHQTVGQPNAWLPITFTDVDGYLGMLSRATRRNLRRKLRTSGKVRIEQRTEIADVADRVFQLYLETRTRARHRYEELTPAYFTGMLARMEGKAFCTLYFVDDELLAANLLVQSGDTLLDKYWCMAAAGQDYSLYHLSWLTNIRHCLAHGLTRYTAGQASPELKRSLGCRFDQTTSFVRHRNAFCNGALGVVLPFLNAQQTDREAA